MSISSRKANFIFSAWNHPFKTLKLDAITQEFHRIKQILNKNERKENLFILLNELNLILNYFLDINIYFSEGKIKKILPESLFDFIIRDNAEINSFKIYFNRDNLDLTINSSHPATIQALKKYAEEENISRFFLILLGSFAKEKLIVLLLDISTLLLTLKRLYFLRQSYTNLSEAEKKLLHENMLNWTKHFQSNFFSNFNKNPTITWTNPIQLISTCAQEISVDYEELLNSINFNNQTAVRCYLLTLNLLKFKLLQAQEQGELSPATQNQAAYILASFNQYISTTFEDNDNIVNVIITENVLTIDKKRNLALIYNHIDVIQKILNTEMDEEIKTSALLYSIGKCFQLVQAYDAREQFLNFLNIKLTQKALLKEDTLNNLIKFTAELLTSIKYQMPQFSEARIWHHLQQTLYLIDNFYKIIVAANQDEMLFNKSWRKIKSTFETKVEDSHIPAKVQALRMLTLLCSTLPITAASTTETINFLNFCKHEAENPSDNFLMRLAMHVQAIAASERFFSPTVGNLIVEISNQLDGVSDFLSVPRVSLLSMFNAVNNTMNNSGTLNQSLLPNNPSNTASGLNARR